MLYEQYKTMHMGRVINTEHANGSGHLMLKGACKS